MRSLAQKISQAIFIILFSLAVLAGAFGSSDVVSAVEIPSIDDQNTFWIRTDGNDSCSGQKNLSYAEDAINCAKLTINAGVNLLNAPGMTLYVVSGTYTDQNIIPSYSGSATNPINIIGVGEPKPYLVGSYSALKGISISKNYINVDNFQLYGFTNATASGSSGCVDTNSNAHDIVISNITAKKCGWMGIGAYASYNVTFRDSSASDSSMVNFGSYGGHDITFLRVASYETSQIGEPWNADYSFAASGASYNIWVIDSVFDAETNNPSPHGHGPSVTGSASGSSHDIHFENVTSRNATQGFEIRGSAYNVWIKNSKVIDARSNGIYFRGELGSNNKNVWLDNVDIGGSSVSCGNGITTWDTINGISVNTISNLYMNNIKAHGFTKCDNDYGIIIPSDSTVTNLIAYGNRKGILLAGTNIIASGLVAYGNSNYGIEGKYFGDVWDVKLTNSISKNNYRGMQNIFGNYLINEGNTFATGGRYSCVIGCSTGDPLFADPANGDFHLQSQAGRWNGAAWVNDSVTSPAIASGDPTTVIANCPSWGCPSRIEMGAYGNTTEASQGFIAPTPTPSLTITPSLTPTPTPSITPTPTSTITPTPAPKFSADLNSDGKVNSQDFAILMSAWNSTDKPKADINQDGLVDSLDFGLMMSFWG